MKAQEGARAEAEAKEIVIAERNQHVKFVVEIVERILSDPDRIGGVTSADVLRVDRRVCWGERELVDGALHDAAVLGLLREILPRKYAK